MLLKIHSGSRILLIGDKPEGAIDGIVGLQHIERLDNPLLSDIQAAVHWLEQAGTGCMLLQGNSPDDILHEIKAHFTCIDAAGGVVSDPEGRILMIFRRGYWDLPKGKVDDGEALEECALREVSEETGYTSIRSNGPITTTYHVYQINGESCLKASHWFRMSFFGKEQAVPQTEEDIEEVVWLRPEQVKEKLPNAYPSIRDVMEALGLSGSPAWG